MSSERITALLKQFGTYLKDKPKLTLNAILGIIVIFYLICLHSYTNELNNQFGFLTWDLKTWSIDKAFGILNYHDSSSITYFIIGVILALFCLLFVLGYFKKSSYKFYYFENQETELDATMRFILTIVNLLFIFMIFSFLNSPILVALCLALGIVSLSSISK